MNNSNEEQSYPAADYDYSNDIISGAEMMERVRERITATAGDPQTLLGTTADATQLLMYGFCSLISKLSSAKSLAEVRDSANEFEPMATSFLGKVQSGQVKLPFMEKGVESVVNDIETRATAVAEVLGGLSE